MRWRFILVDSTINHMKIWAFRCRVDVAVVLFSTKMILAIDAKLIVALWWPRRAHDGNHLQKQNSVKCAHCSALCAKQQSKELEPG